MVQTAVRLQNEAGLTWIAGGFVLIPARLLIKAWHDCRTSPLTPADFRTWLACHEMRARRHSIETDRSPTYTPNELARLLGVTPKRANASLRRLVKAGLVQWEEVAIEFPTLSPEPPEILRDTIGRGVGDVAVPRRILRRLVGGARPALIATALAILLRCLSRRRDGFDGRGRVKSSWIARTFGVDLRRVKAARREWIDLGWIEPETDDQLAMNRWGRTYRINLRWERRHDPQGAILPPPPAEIVRVLPPPLLDQEPLREEFKNQEPVRSESAGVEVKGQEGEGHSDVPPPKLDDIRPEDLRETARTLELFEQAVSRKLIGSSESSRLKFVAAAEHARAVGTVNPCGLFARLIRRGWWHFATQDDEDAAARRIRLQLHGRPRTTDRPAVRTSTFVPEATPAAPSSLAALLGRIQGFGAS